MTKSIIDVPLNQKLLWSVPEFCSAVGISKFHYYTLLKQNAVPAGYLIGRRRVISVEDARAWVRERTAAASA